MSTTPESSGNRRDYTYMKYNLYRRCCTFGWQYTSKPTGNSAGTAATATKAPAAWTCTPYLKGSQESVDTYCAWRTHRRGRPVPLRPERLGRERVHTQRDGALQLRGQVGPSLRHPRQAQQRLQEDLRCAS